MIEDFFHQIETELGPLSSDWFKELTAKASKDESFPGAVEHEASSRTEDGTFRAPQETPALESQMSSTPRLFRVRGPLSPHSVLGRSPNPGMQTPLSTLPWTDSSPCLFGSVQDSSAKRISESLGAQLHPDLSWSSNFNTPGAMSPTVILTIYLIVLIIFFIYMQIVRKLFPSLSKEENAQTKGPDESFDNVEGLWRQTVPDAINDSDVRDTVESVLDGAEDVLSIFFSNSSSALRRVKSKERTKKRVNGVSKDVKPAALATQHSTDQTDQTLASNVDLDINSLNSSSTCTSVNSDSGEDALKDSITQLGQSSPDSYTEKSQLRSSLLAASPALTFSRKPRKFVYQVQSPFPPTKERKRNNAQESSLTTTGKNDPQTSDTVGDCLVHPKEPPVKQGNPGALNVDHGLDMTQLCNAFAEDFTQEISLEKSAVNTECDNDVHTMSTCMSDAIKIDEVQTKAESVLHSDDGAEHLEFPANHKEASDLTSRSRMENTLSESLKHENGYPAVFNDVSGLSSSCNDGADKYLYSGFKTANNKLIHVPPEALMKAKATMNTAVRSDGLNTGSGTALNSSVVSTWSSERYSHALNKPEREPTGNLLHGSLDVASGCTSTSYLPKTNDSGFKTASNRSITISSVNLEKAKDIFKELEVENLYKTDICPSSNAAELEIQVMKNAKVPKLDIKRNVDGNYVLTASQKADVTELCSMLEDADSQYEFTQFRQAKPCSKSMESSRSEREWDPEILSGIDFDDSFNCDTERQLPRKWPVRPDLPTQNGPVSNSMKNGEVFTQSKETPKAELSLNDYRLTLRSDGREMAKTPAVQTNTSEGNEPVCVGFKTARGNSVRISEKNLTKARSLFADLEDCVGKIGLKSDHNSVTICSTENPEDQDNPQGTKQNEKPDLLVDTRHCGFSTAGGKELKVSESSLLKAKKLLNKVSDQCEAVPSIKAPPNRVTTLKVANINLQPSVCSNSKVSENVFPHNLKMSCKSLTGNSKDQMFRNSESHHRLSEIEQQTTAKYQSTKSIQSSGFKMASGKGVSFSSSAIEKSRAIFRDLDSLIAEDGSNETKSMDENAKLHDEAERSQCKFANGFKMASGKGVSFSEGAFLKSKSSVMDNCAPEILQFTSGCGFSTASGKMVSVSAEALQKAKAVLDDSSAASPCEIKADVSEEKNKKGVPKTDTYIPGRSLGFSTASGRKVAISDRALEKAKNLFTEVEVEDLANNGSILNSAQTKPLGSEQTRCLGFSTASGKGVAVSEKTLKEAKAVFAGCEDILETADVHKPLKTGRVVEEKDKGSLNQSLTNREFQTCESANFRLSSGKCEEINNANKSNVKVEQFGFSTASGKGVSVSKSALKVAFEMFRDCDVQPITEEQHPVAQIDCPSSSDETRRHTTDTTTLSLSTQAIRDDSSLLNSHALSLNGCTMTQQKYLEQEAMACTKALLEDDFNEHSRSEPVEETVIRKCPTLAEQRSYEVIIGERKRTSDADLTGQPPLKRRLISEFDQISDGTRVCVPVKSSPNGTLTDRRVFKGNVHLKPNITHPSRNIMDQNASKALDGEKRRPSNPKAVIFIPPFQKNIKPTRKVPTNYVSRDNAKVPTMFIPPVKKNPMSNVLQGNSIQSCTDSDCEKLEKEDTLESLELARDMQDMRIRKKKSQTIRPLPGSIYLAKTSGVTRISLREAVNNKCPLLHSQEKLYQYGVHCQVSQITAENAELFRFNFDDFFKREMFIDNTGVQLADGGWLIPDNRGTVGKEEFYKAMCDTPGVDPKLMSEAWVFNHYRWVVWKRACMERTFPEVMGGRCLTPEQVLLQLKLRYDTEVDNSRRSALKKIMERDDTPAKTLVLAVCGFAKSSSSPVNSEKAVGTPDSKTSESTAAIIWLTDGWYSIKALLDPPLSSMLQKGRLSIGGKVMIHGAELIGSQDACLPLEAPDSLMLKISANSTRRARWDSKLGFYKDPRPFSLPLSSLYSNGGVVGCVDVIVLRSYPTQWMEKRTGGVFVFRNERAEDREARRHSSAKQKTMELLFTRIQAQFEKEEEEKKKTRRRKRFRRCDIHSMQDGEELYEAMENDPAHLSAQQMEAVSSYRRVMADRRQVQLQERMQKSVQEAQESEGLCPNRDVTPVWKLTIADFSDLHSNCTYTLNIWRPSLELRSLLKEGCRYKAYYLSTSETKKRSGTANVQFTATKKTQFQDIEVCPEWLMANFPARQFTIFRDLQNSAFSSPCGEVDVVGYVISILDRQGASPVLYLVDDKFDFVSVRSFSSLVQLALEDLVKPLTLLAISNLQLRELSGPVPRLYAGEQALFSVNPKEAHLQEAMAHLKTFVQSYENFFSVAEEKLSNLLPSGSVKPAQSPRTLGVSSVPKLNSRINVTPQAPKVHSPFTPVSRRAPTPTDQTTEPKDPKSLKRKRGIDFLSRVPSPPPLNPLNILTSPNVKKTFNPPRRSETNRPARRDPAPSRRSASLAPSVEEQWVNDEELAMINTQTLLD
uniref:BRCA2 DNA repair associated n=1 Tax=Astyanax mexicanus TaxID=7994 RepID=W5L0S8_ASTMX